MSRIADPALPGLAAALDLDLVLELLRAALPECRQEIDLTGGAIWNVRYKPGVYCSILYRLQLRDRADHR